VSSPDRQLGVDLFNEAWRLMESREDDDRLLLVAYASAYHWAEAAECTPANRARSEWQLSRMLAGEPSAAAWREKARTARDAIADTEDREHFDEDFATL
jgi:hypothetical protein